MSYIQFQLRRGLASEWYSANPALADGEIGLETDTRLYKIGDGTTHWRLLSYGSLGGDTPSAVYITTSTAASSTTTGALTVTGGVGIGGSIYAGNIYSNGALLGTSSTEAVNLLGGTTGSIAIQSGPDYTTFIPIGDFGTVLYSDGSTATWVAGGSISSTTATNSQNVYIQQTNESINSSGTFYITMSELYDDFSPLSVVSTVSWDDTLNRLSSPNVKVSGTTVATTTNTGALQIVGGVGIGKGLYVGGTITATNMTLNGYQVSTSSALTIQLSGASQGNASTINFSTGTTVSVVTGVATVQAIQTLQQVTGQGASSSNAISITNSTAVTKTVTGALIVTGGVGVGGGVYVGGTVTATNMTLNGYQVSTSSALTIQLSGASQGNASTINFSTGTTVSVVTGVATVQSSDTLQLVTGRGASSSNAISISNGTQSTNSSTGALTVSGGVGIGGNLNVGGTVTATNMTLNGYQVSTSSALTIQLSGSGQGNASTINFSTGTTVSVVTGVATVQAVQTLQQVTGQGASSSNAISISNATQSTNSSTGALTVSGGVGIGGNLNVGGTLQVSAATTFGGPVTFSGTATYVLSTNTYYTDNLIEVHTPPSGVSGQWASDDGKDIGLRFHYYNRTASTDSNAALILADDSQYLEWYNTGAESNTGTFTGANYGTFKTGSIILTNTTASSSTTTGALTVVGGAGIGGNLYVGGTTTVAGGVTFSTTGTLTSPKLQSYKETVNTIGSVVSNTNLDVSTANIFDVTLGGSPITFTFINPPSSGTAQPVTVILRQDVTGNRLATFTNAKYTDSNLPVLSTGSNQVDVLTFFTVNGGAFWFGTFAMANVS